MIPVSVVVATRNEEANIGRCLAALGDFAEVIVVDSCSTDATAQIAQAAGARVICFMWNGAYPKKRQWCLENLQLRHDWIFFVDADEVLAEPLVREIEKVFRSDPAFAGYFVRGRYVLGGRKLRFGLANNKLCLFDRRKFMFQAVDDLAIPGMGEMEGHYQPVLKADWRGERIGQLRRSLFHYAYDRDWEDRHRRYAAWERGMNERGLWPADPLWFRQKLKAVFRAMPGRSLAAFLHCYIWRLAFLDGVAGFKVAYDRFRYYRMI